MTRVGFYVLKSSAPESRLEVATRLTEKAFQQGHRVFIHAASQEQAALLDEKLWQLRPASFLPHALAGEDSCEAISIGWGQEPGEHSGLLINLQYTVPPFFSRFERVAEVVTQDPESLAALRQSWQFYRQRGYQMDKHDL
ncbi:MAG: DNA polymerase III subunit chi [Halioglobus sp.]|nr:DNA polymerase III subunit chi [Halioglobus sp.]